MLAQAIGEYGLLAGIAGAVQRVSVSVEIWIREWGFTLMVVAVFAVGGWVLLRMLRR